MRGIYVGAAVFSIGFILFLEPTIRSTRETPGSYFVEKLIYTDAGAAALGFNIDDPFNRQPDQVLWLDRRDNTVRIMNILFGTIAAVVGAFWGSATQKWCNPSAR